MNPSSTTRVARAAIAQLRSTSSKTSNLVNVAKCAGWAKRDGAAMLFLPENLGFMGENSQQTLEEADPPIIELEQQRGGINKPPRMEITPFRRVLADTIASHSGGGRDIDDDWSPPSLGIKSIIEELCFIAWEANLWISGGGIHTMVPPSEASVSSEEQQSKIYNTHVIINNLGQIKAHYHKIHLFDVGAPINLQESKTTSPGNKLVVVDSPVGKLGLSICYDVRFPEMYVELVQRGGAEVLLVPSAFTVPTGRAHWHALLRARAIESQCYVLAAAQVGRHNEKRQSYGHSVAYDPWGELVADAGGYDGVGTSGTVDESPSNNTSPVRVPSIILCDIDKLASVRERMPIQQHRDDSSFSF